MWRFLCKWTLYENLCSVVCIFINNCFKEYNAVFLCKLKRHHTLENWKNNARLIVAHSRRTCACYGPLLAILFLLFISKTVNDKALKLCQKVPYKVSYNTANFQFDRFVIYRDTVLGKKAAHNRQVSPSIKNTNATRKLRSSRAVILITIVIIVIHNRRFSWNCTTVLWYILLMRLQCCAFWMS